MPLFRSNRPTPPTEEEQQAADLDLERIRQGGIPLGAEQRLKRVATASTPFFTSDLSAKEYAIAQAGGLQPIAQVMGSSVVQHGWTGQAGAYYWTTGEVPALSDPWNLARDRAFDRLRQEAELAGADGVIGIEINGGSIAGPGTTELIVFGTAVRDAAHPRTRGDALELCTLSGQDVDKLHRIGAEPCAVVGHTTVVAVQLGMNSAWVMNAGGGMLGGGVARQNVEIHEIAYGVQQARGLAMNAVQHQARAARATNLVISTLQHTIDHREYESGGFTHHYFYVTMNILGTAIRGGAREPHPAPLTGPVMTIDLRG